MFASNISPAPGRRDPRTYGFEGQWGLPLGRAEGLWETDHTLKGLTQNLRCSKSQLRDKGLERA